MNLSFLHRSAAAVFLMASTGLAFGQAKGSGLCVTHFGQKDWAILLEDVPAESKANLIGNVEVRKQQVDNLSLLFAYSCEAIKRGLDREKTISIELKSIKSESIAVAYDRHVKKKMPGVPFGRITDAQVEKFYGVPKNVGEFGEFLDAKLALLKQGNLEMADRDASEEERREARELFAKLKITEAEYLKAAPVLGPKFRSRVALQTHMQQVQFLARTIVETVVAQATASDAEIDQYITKHPEFETSKKRELASKLLERAKAGEDLAGLADQYTDDPGNNGADGSKHGGLYSGMAKGIFVPPFENAALSLKAGELYPSLVETDFGYHIVKLEKLTGGPDDVKYDVRHILISTGIKDPVDPSGRETPLRVFVKTTLETDKETVISQRILAANPVVVEDYVPPVEAVAKKPARKRVTRKRS